MEARATLKFLRISPRKTKIVLDLIRGVDAAKAMAILKFTPKAACEPIEKLLASAIANGTFNIFASVCASNVLPHPVGPRSNILLFCISTSSSLSMFAIRL